MENNEFTGRCHCGNIRYRLSTHRNLNELPVRRCNCSFCRKHGAVYTSDPSGVLDIDIKEPEAVKKYRFSSGVVEFLICANCGVMTAATASIDGNLYGVIIANSMDDPIATTPEEKKFAEETLQDGLERRKRNWIQRVSISYQE